MPYQFFDHDADVGVIGMGSSYPDAFVQAALGMFSLMADMEQVRPTEAVRIVCRAPSLEELFLEWLNTWLYERDRLGLCFSDFYMEQFSDTCLVATGRGQPWAEVPGDRRAEVKAATYCMLEVRREDGVCRCQCVLDI